MRIMVDRERCIGSAECVQTAPELFDQSDRDGRVVLVVAEQPAAAPEQVLDAVSRCPSRALTLAGE
jgi:ferredoxin